MVIERLAMTTKESSVKRKQFPLYLLPGEDAEGRLFAALDSTKRRQEMLRDFTLLGYLCAQAGIRLDPTKQALQSVANSAVAPFAALQPASASSSVSVGGRSHMGATEPSGVISSPTAVAQENTAVAHRAVPREDVGSKYRGLV